MSALLLGAVTSLAACGKGDGPAAPAGAAAPDVPLSGIRLLDAGRGEKAPLRFRYTKGTKDALVLEATTSFGAAVPLPPMTMTTEVTLEVVDVEADGTAVVDTTTGGMTMTGGPASEASAGLAKLSTRARMRVSPRGEMLSSDLNLDTTALDPELRRAMEAMQANLKETFGQTGVVWPEEPVGPGARWVFRRKMKAGMVDADVNVETTLVARDGDRVTLDSRMKLSMGDQDFEVPGGGTKLHLGSMTGSGGIQQTATLTSPASTFEMTLVLAMELDMPGAKADAPPSTRKMEFTTTQRLRRKD